MYSAPVDKISVPMHDHSLPKEPFIAAISDYTLSLIVPVVTHWLTSAIYEIFQYFGLFQNYRIHSDDEEKAKNTISRLECLRGVILVQILQTSLGAILGAFAGEEMAGNEDHDIQLWTGRVHDLVQTILTLQSWCSTNISTLSPSLYRLVTLLVPLRTSWEGYEVELFVAKLIYYGFLPALRFYVALWLADTWVFFIHRAEHGNQWLYRNFHARHHELYVPYSWGGIYDHPAESLFLSVGAFFVAIFGSGMTLRESMAFSAFSSAKACTDHGGYHFPWNPIDLCTSVGAAYHDKHHQRWGLKKNFALHFSFWDRVLGTEFTDEEAAAMLYERDRRVAKMAREQNGHKIKNS